MKPSFPRFVRTEIFPTGVCCIRRQLFRTLSWRFHNKQQITTTKQKHRSPLWLPNEITNSSSACVHTRFAPCHSSNVKQQTFILMNASTKKAKQSVRRGKKSWLSDPVSSCSRTMIHARTFPMHAAIFSMMPAAATCIGRCRRNSLPSSKRSQKHCDRFTSRCSSLTKRICFG